MSIANTLELAMLALINDERAEAGLSPLRMITLLNQAAEDHSSWMLENDSFSHEGADDTSPSDRMAGAGYGFDGRTMALENIGWQSARGLEGHGDDVAQIHESLMASPGHRANILNPDVQDIGIGIEIGTFAGDAGMFEAVMVTQVFASTEADLSAWVDPGTIPDEAEVVAMDDPAEDTPSTGDEVLPETAGDDSDTPYTPEVVETDIAMETETETETETAADTEEIETETVSETEVDTEESISETETDDTATAGDDDTPPEEMAEDTPAMPPQMPLPFDFANFTVDLSSAFDFRMEGDQMIWETSEDRLVEAFLAAIEDWADLPEDESDEDDAEDDDLEDDAEDDEMAGSDAGDLPELPEIVVFGDEEDEEEMDDWLMESCV
jgi:hypothetical protein